MSLHLLDSLHQENVTLLREFLHKIALRMRTGKIRYMARNLSDLLELGALVMTDAELDALFPDLEKRLTAAIDSELKPFVKYKVQLQNQTAVV